MTITGKACDIIKVIQWFFEKCGSIELKVQIVEVQGESKKK